MVIVKKFIRFKLGEKITDKKSIAVIVLSAAIMVSVGAVSVSSLMGINTGNVSQSIAVNESSADNGKKNTSESYSNEKLQLEQDSIYITEDKEYTITLSKGNGADIKEISWKSDNEEVVKVDENGVVTPVADGTAEVICVDEKTGDEQVCHVTVSLPEVEAENIELNYKTYTLSDVGEKVKLTAEVLPKNTTDKSVTWKSEDENIVQVDKNGVVRSVDWGSAKIICETANGKKTECEIKTEPAVKVEKVMLNYEELEFSGPEAPTETLAVFVYPEDATQKEVTFASTDESVAIVDEEGTVSFVADGECDVVATSTDGTYKSSKCHIIVKDSELVYIPDNAQAYTPNVYVPVNPQPADTVIDEASRYVGVIPYIWGGTDLSRGVDCSGFICAVYQRFGYNLWGIRTDLCYAGEEVKDISQAKAGDILVYKGHVALYDGNGGRIHAPDIGCMVSHDYNIGGYYTIRRVIN